ncbi:unnamed protein product [Victoria cruziana]
MSGSLQFLSYSLNATRGSAIPGVSCSPTCVSHTSVQLSPKSSSFPILSAGRGKRNSLPPLCTSYDQESMGRKTDSPSSKSDDERPESSNYEALLRGGEQVTSVLQEMVYLLEDMDMDEKSEKVAVELAAQGVIGQRVDRMEPGFLMALDYMIQTAEKDNDDQRRSILEVIKQTVMDHLTKKCPPHVQVIGILCRTPLKESRHELLCRAAAGGGAFKSDKGTKVQLPGANLNDIANQADDLLETMEIRQKIPDRKLLARLVLIREEARSMMGGGILDERNDRGLTTLPEAEVNFLTKLVALSPGKSVRNMIADVMEGKCEGAEVDINDQTSSALPGREGVTGRNPLPVRPGMFLETVAKVLKGIYAGNVSGITAQHLEWVHQETLQILQEIAF